MKIKQFTTELDKIFTIKQAENFDNVEIWSANLQVVKVENFNFDERLFKR